MELIQSLKDTVSIEKNSRGFNFSLTIHSEDLLKEWDSLKVKIDSMVEELSLKYGEKAP